MNTEISDNNKRFGIFIIRVREEQAKEYGTEKHF